MVNFLDLDQIWVLSVNTIWMKIFSRTQGPLNYFLYLLYVRDRISKLFYNTYRTNSRHLPACYWNWRSTFSHLYSLNVPDNCWIETRIKNYWSVQRRNESRVKKQTKKSYCDNTKSTVTILKAVV